MTSFDPSARHPLSDGVKAAGRAIAEGAPRLAPSALFAFAGHVARAAVEAAALVAFLVAVVTWAAVLMGRV